jgi:hypothetical protein
MRKSKPLKNDELERISKYDNMGEDKDINKNILIEPTVAITRTRYIGINTLPSS